VLIVMIGFGIALPVMPLAPQRGGHELGQRICGGDQPGVKRRTRGARTRAKREPFNVPPRPSSRSSRPPRSSAICALSRLRCKRCAPVVLVSLRAIGPGVRPRITALGTWVAALQGHENLRPNPFRVNAARRPLSARSSGRAIVESRRRRARARARRAARVTTARAGRTDHLDRPRLTCLGHDGQAPARTRSSAAVVVDGALLDLLGGACRARDRVDRPSDWLSAAASIRRTCVHSMVRCRRCAFATLVNTRVVELRCEPHDHSAWHLGCCLQGHE